MSQKDLIVLLFSGTVKFLTKAKRHLKENAIGEFSDAIERAHRIIYHLYTTLDFEKGGEIAERLGALYTFIIGQLYIVNSTKNENIISDLLIILNNLKEGWQGLNPESSDTPNGAGQDLNPSGPQTVVSTKV